MSQWGEESLGSSTELDLQADEVLEDDGALTLAFNSQSEDPEKRHQKELDYNLETAALMGNSAINPGRIATGVGAQAGQYDRYHGSTKKKEQKDLLYNLLIRLEQIKARIAALDKQMADIDRFIMLLRQENERLNLERGERTFMKNEKQDVLDEYHETGAFNREKAIRLLEMDNIEMPENASDDEIRASLQKSINDDKKRIQEIDKELEENDRLEKEQEQKRKALEEEKKRAVREIDQEYEAIDATEDLTPEEKETLKIERALQEKKEIVREFSANISDIARIEHKEQTVQDLEDTPEPPKEFNFFG